MDCADNKQKSCPPGACDNLGAEGVISPTSVPRRDRSSELTSKSKKSVLFLATEIEDLLMPA